MSPWTCHPSPRLKTTVAPTSARMRLQGLSLAGEPLADLCHRHTLFSFLSPLVFKLHSVRPPGGTL